MQHLKKSLFALLIFINVCSARNNYFDKSICPNYHIEKELPAFTPPDKKSFKHFKNRVLTYLFSPHHLVIDEVFNVQDSVTITGKFDYDWVLHKDLEGENILAYVYSKKESNWRLLGSEVTSKDGKASFNLGQLAEGTYLIRMVVEGDGSSADGVISVVKTGQEAIVFDIDATLTQSDFQVLQEYLRIKHADMRPYAKELVESYRYKKYLLIFLTARPYWMGDVSRYWLKNILYTPAWQLKTKNSLFGHDELPDPTHAAEYKTNYLKELVSHGVVIKRAYGNAKTDIEAYENVNIPKGETFIIGENAGYKDTQPIIDGYFNHIQTVVTNTDEANCLEQ